LQTGIPDVRSHGFQDSGSEPELHASEGTADEPNNVPSTTRRGCSPKPRGSFHRVLHRDPTPASLQDSIRDCIRYSVPDADRAETKSGRRARAPSALSRPHWTKCTPLLRGSRKTP